MDIATLVKWYSGVVCSIILTHAKTTFLSHNYPTILMW
jgi:hypothetical protein